MTKKKQKIKQNSDEQISFDELARLAEENGILKEKNKELQDKNLRIEIKINLLKKSQAYGMNLRISGSIYYFEVLVKKINN